MAIRVLLVDDVADVRRLVRMALRVRGGFEVVAEAGSGAEAVEQVGLHHPDVVVLDLGLPDIAGQEVLVRIRSSSPGSKVVIFSGTDPSDDSSIFTQVEGYVVKDSDVEYLVDLLESVGSTAAEQQATLELPPELTSVREARRFASAKLDEWHLSALADDVLLVVSELTSNAITHADSHCRLRLSLNRATVRIEVLDTGHGTPEPQEPSVSAESGRGLYLVDALTTAWGMELLANEEKVVWAELARST